MEDYVSYNLVARQPSVSKVISATLFTIMSLCVVKSFAASGTYVPNSTLYPRLVRLSHGAKAVNGQIIASTNGNIFLSKDGSASFTFLDTVPTREGSKERCCATLYEMPRRVGSLQAGTLLFAGSYFSSDTPAVEIYTSMDQGRTWNYLSSPVVRGSAKHGLWEPELTLADNGVLVMFRSDETDECYSQKLVQMRIYDGTTWRDQRYIVPGAVYDIASMVYDIAGAIYDDRHGTVIMSKLAVTPTFALFAFT